MPSHIAFLRGINVGGHRVKMDRLRGLFSEMGFREISTFIASGNVHFSSRTADAGEVRRAVEEGLAQALGYEVETFLRTPTRLAEIARHGTTQAPGVPEWRAAEGAAHYVLFLHGPAPEMLRSALGELESHTDRFIFDGHEAHWWIRGKMSDSPLFGGPLDRVLKALPNTMRNMNTVRRIVAKVSSPNG